MTSLQLPAQLQSITALVDAKPESLATGSSEIRDAALQASTFIFDLSLQSEPNARSHIDKLLSSLTPESAPQTRSQARANGKRKRSPSPKPKHAFTPTPLSSLYMDGVDEEQIWSQLDLRVNNVCSLLELALEGGPESGKPDESDAESLDPDDPRLKKIIEALNNGEDVDFESLGLDGLDFGGEDEEDDDDSDAETSEESSEEDEEQEDMDTSNEQIHALRDPSDEDEDDEDDLELDTPPKKKSRGPRRRHSELDDDFFNLAAFNAQTEAAEARAVSRGRLGGDDDEDDSDDDVSVDLFAPVDDDEAFEEEDEDNAGEAYYKDFFAPPPKSSTKGKGKQKAVAQPSPRKAGTVRFDEEVRVKRIKAKGKSLPLSTMYEDGDDDDDSDDDESPFGMDDDFGEMDGMDEDGESENDGMDDEEDDEDDDEEEDGEEDDDDDESDSLAGFDGDATIDRLKDDLFAEDDEVVEDDLTTHERRMAALKEQIASLEAENVGKKDWVLMGEATSKSRPQNSLLEEDLEFERTMKAVPVVTEEKVQALEDRIKARILERQFDDVVRIRPVDDKPFLPSRLLELQDTKSSQSLAQIYEDEYVAGQTGAPVDDRDGKLKKEHEEIEKQWENISAKLDALCNAHYVPKQPKATITTLSNVSTATLESALPTSASTATLLAPEEVFKPTSKDFKAKSEMTPMEKRAVHNKKRKTQKKTRALLDKSVDKFAKSKGVKKQKQAALESVVKSGKGVTVVGKKKQDILGKKGGKKGKS